MEYTKNPTPTLRLSTPDDYDVVLFGALDVAPLVRRFGWRGRKLRRIRERVFAAYERSLDRRQDADCELTSDDAIVTLSALNEFAATASRRGHLAAADLAEVKDLRNFLDHIKV